MNGTITRLGIVVLSMFALVIGSSVCYSVAQTAEDCEGLEERAALAADMLAGCEQYGDCGRWQGHLDYWECSIARCWDAVDNVCSDTGCACIPAA